MKKRLGLAVSFREGTQPCSHPKTEEFLFFLVLGSVSCTRRMIYFGVS